MTCCAMQGTEMPFSSPLDMNYKKGTYSCAGCDLPTILVRHQI